MFFSRPEIAEVLGDQFAKAQSLIQLSNQAAKEY